MSYTELTAPREVRCRKEHECGWCGKRLFEKELAMFRSYIFEGGPQSEWMHPECHSAMDRTPRDILQDGWLPGDFVRGSIEWA